MRRVVITGMGVVSPLGNDVESTWQHLLAGTSGAGPIVGFETSDDFPVRFACEVKDFDPTRVQSLFDEARSVGVALDGAGLGFAAREALERLMARLDDSPDGRTLMLRVAQAAKLFRELPFEVDLRRAENGYFRLLEEVAPEVRKRVSSGDVEASQWIELFEELGETLRFAGSSQTS